MILEQLYECVFSVNVTSATIKMMVPSATSGIVVSNPVMKRFVTKLPDSKPEVRVVVTEQNHLDAGVSGGHHQDEVKPRRARKADLTKCLSDFSKIKSVPSSSSELREGQEHFIILGDMGDKTVNIDNLISDSFSLPKFVDEEDPLAPIIYVQCPECKKRLKQKSYRSHLRTHLGVKQFKCDLCGDGFTRKNDVKRHMKLIHEKPRNFKCDICQKYFVTEENLKCHKNKHKNEMKCRVCNHGFGKREYFDNHIKFVHPAGDRSNVIEVSDEDMNPDDPDPEPDPIILRRKEKRKSQNDDIPFHDMKQSKVILLGDIRDKSNKEAKILQDNPASKEKEDTSTKTNNPPRFGQLVQMEDGTFVIVNCDEDTESLIEGEEQAQEGSQVFVCISSILVLI